ncbi:FtsH protease activity modulator HflK [Anaplasmataceae bacterium AB001_6]|nr:FtsH protease activity modulator HflK [Anaplasmataceae bacterium AB001_6]
MFRKLYESFILNRRNPWSDDENDSGRGLFSEFINMKNGKYGDMMPNGKMFNIVYFILILLIAFLIYVLSGFYILQPEEEGVELFFGKYSRVTGPGLHYHLPYPIASVKRVKYEFINREDISSYYSSNRSGGEILMLTGDENIVNVDFSLQWKIVDSYKFLYSVNDDPIFTIVNAMEGVMRDVIAQSNIAFILTGEGRAVIASRTKKMLQEILDLYGMGIEVISVQLKTVDPPAKVISAFRDVQTARADREKFINASLAYQNEVIPKARGISYEILENAEAYKQSIILSAQGDAERFRLVYDKYLANPSVMKNRLYIDVMRNILSDSEVIFMNSNSSLLPFLNLDNSGVKNAK